MASEVSVNLFIKTKGGFKAHVQAKLSDDEATAENALAVLQELETSATAAGATADAFQGATGGSRGTGNSERRFESKNDSGDGQCPNGCGIRPRVEAGVSKKTGNPYNAFWGECRTCGYKGR